ncbi:scavenger receptor class B member 1-like isoform X2 [Varroa jacobsoni]|uniref:scavenger receptor class B member 1-like isoform X2 n=1 Tax=Varroa jacobsoni TaxID=62625 RepID=UPI000BF4B34A|nr:scavenger receptor class B member 1-like isoform X2 [Varroa jacobsoni]
MSVPEEEIQFKQSHEAKKDEVSHFNFDANNRPTKKSAPFLNFLRMGVNAGRGAGVICVVVGAFLVVLGAAVLTNFTATFQFILSRKVVLSSTAQGFPIWRDVSDHLDTKTAWYFFNLTNPKEFVQGTQPILQEVGPFWYKTILKKINIEFLDNKTVTFEEHREFEFDAENSVLPNTTRITMINVPVMSALQRLKPLGYFARLAVDPIIKAAIADQQLTANYSVAELTYDGVYNNLVALSKIKEGFLEAIFALNSKDNKKGKFGFGVDKHDPTTFNMFTGGTGVMDLNRIYSINHKHVLSMWPNIENTTCNIVDGTFGYLRPPMNESNEQKVYIPDMCRPVTIRYEKDVNTNGIRLRRFILGKENFYNREAEPANACYDEIYREPSGVAEAGPCKQGAPILLSMPHFMHADPSFSEKVIGMNADPERHTFIMDHEPMTGMTVTVRGRLQANFRVTQLDCLDGEKLPELLMPLFWQELYVEAGPGIVAFLHRVLSYPGLAKIALIIVLLLGIIISIIGAGFLMNHSRRTRQTEQLNPTKYHKMATQEATRKPELDQLV